MKLSIDPVFAGAATNGKANPGIAMKLLKKLFR